MMNKKTCKHILPQLFDIKPVKEDGDLHLEKIYSVKKCLNLKSVEKENIFQKKQEIKIHSSRLRQSSGRLPDGRFAQEALAPILINYYQPYSKSSIIAKEDKNIIGDFASFNELQSESDNISKANFLASLTSNERKRILAELEAIMAGRQRLD